MTTGSNKTGSTGTGAGTAAPKPAPAVSAPAQPAPSAPPPEAQAQPGRVSRFFRSLLSHLAFAAVITLGVLGYLYHAQILRDVGNRVCAENMLGQYMTDHPSRSATSNAASGSTTGTTAGPDAIAPVAASRTPQTDVTISSAASGNVAAHDAKPARHKTETTRPKENPEAATMTATTLETPGASSAGPIAKEVIASVEATSGTTPAPIAEKNSGTLTGQSETASASVTLQAAPPTAQPAASKPPSSMAPPASTAGTPQTEGTQEKATALNTLPVTTPTPAAPTKETAKATPTARPAPPARSGLSLAKSWQAAREAYAAGKPEAISAYQELAAAFPDMPELTGELGNIYYAQKRYEEAAEQYLQTAKRLVNQNREMEASCMADILAQLAPDKAQEVRAMTSAPCQRRR